jgi:hypothetical protein
MIAVCLDRSLFRRQGRALAKVVEAAVDPQNLGLDAQPVAMKSSGWGARSTSRLDFGQGGEFAALACPVPPPLRAFAWSDVCDSGI